MSSQMVAHFFVELYFLGCIINICIKGETGVLENLKPYNVFKYFEELCSIPHGSGNCEAIANYCVEFAKKHNLEYVKEGKLTEDNKYYVVIGAFQSYENARALMKKAARYGYSPILLSCRHGLIGVGVCPVDEYEDALKALQILRREKFCPSDIWIYTNKR